MIKKGCTVGFFGMGKSNIALLSQLPLEKCSITIRSDREISPSDIPNGVEVDRVLFGRDACLDVNEDILFFSPSAKRDRPELLDAKEKGVIFSSDAELFFEENSRPVFAVTGSDGKSTTATLIHLILKEGGYNSELIGNIGEPLIFGLNKSADCFVIELSSFMLEYFTPKSTVACITNITPNHLDWHDSFDNYKKTKLSITKGSERFVISDDNVNVMGAYGIISSRTNYESLKENYKAESYITKDQHFILKNEERLINLDDVYLKEEHNIKNLMMAIAVTDGMVEVGAITRVAKDFKGLPHRCERFFSDGEVEYIDSSIDSTPARTVQTLKSLGGKTVIILGGRGKGLDYSELIPAVKKYVKKAVIVGENAIEIYNSIKNYTDAEIVRGFESAVIRGAELAKGVGRLLLSPASTSYDTFKDYAERGEKFKEILLKLKQ